MKAIHKLLKSYHKVFFILNNEFKVEQTHGINFKNDKLTLTKEKNVYAINISELREQQPKVLYEPVLIKLPLYQNTNQLKTLFAYSFMFKDKADKHSFLHIIADIESLEGLNFFDIQKKLKPIASVLKFSNKKRYLGSYTTDNQNKIVSIENGLANSLHYQPEELVGKPISYIIPKAPNTSHVVPLTNLKEETIQENKVLFKNSKDETNIFRKIEVPLNGPEDQTLILISQVTADQQLLNTYQKNEKDSISNEASDKLIVQTTKDGIINWASQGFLTLTGYAIEEIIGKDLFIFCGEKTDMKAVEKMLSHFAKNNTPYEFKLHFYKKNRSSFKNTQRIACIFNDKGEITGYTVTIVNITKMYHDQRKLKQLIHVCNLLHESVIITNEKGLIEWVNKEFEKKTEYTLEEIVGKSPGSFLQGKDTNENDINSFRKNLKTGRPFTQTILNYSKSGEKYIATIEITPISNKNGEVTNFIGIQQFVNDTQEHNDQSKDMILEVMQELSLQYEALRKKQEEIEIQNNTLKEAYKLLEKLNLKIKHSINYAQKLQSSIIPNQFYIERKLGNAFIINQPKDIVSGDFYWFYETPLWQRVIVGDCTGHGISGAFMTVMATSLLDQFIKNCELEDIPDAFNQLNTYIKNKLISDTLTVEGASVDGFEFGFLQLDKNKNTYHYLGSKMDLIKIDKDNVQRVKAHRFPIGGSIKFYNDKRFHEIHTFQTKPDEFVFLFSDGIPDQFDNNNQQKYTSKRLRSFLHSNITLPVEEQRTAVLSEIKRWQGEQPQTDDIILMGLKPHKIKKYNRLNKRLTTQK